MAAVSDPTRDAVDALFDESDGDLFDGLDSDLETRRQESRKRRASEEKENNDLGVDEEIKITKKRKPVAKLDDTRLLSQAGIPKLRSSYKSKLAGRWKGKGHEFANAAKLLNFYQLWLDALYPKANFADGLTMIEKVGHSKRMQIERKTWIDEGKPRPDYIDDRDYIATSGQAKAADQKGSGERLSRDDRANDMFVTDDQPKQKEAPEGPDVPDDDDDLDALLAAQSDAPPVKAPLTKAIPAKAPQGYDSEGEDDLDALLADYDHRKAEKPVPTQDHKQDEESENDDLDALLAEHDNHKEEKPVSTAQPKNDEESDEDELDALLASHDNGPALQADDLDALLAEHDNQERSASIVEEKRD